MTLKGKFQYEMTAEESKHFRAEGQGNTFKLRLLDEQLTALSVVLGMPIEVVTAHPNCVYGYTIVGRTR